MNKLGTVGLVFVLCLSCNPEKQVLEKVERWDVFELVLQGPVEGSPFFDIQLSAEFTLGEEKVKVPGFYDGDGIYRIRFSPAKEGKWTYRTTSNDASLNEQSGSFDCISPSHDNHGPLSVVNTFYLQYADGTPFYAVGTTAYQWTSVKQSIQEKTVETLTNAPFNKIRMCVFPKSYKYGNDTEPWQYAFKRENGKNDYSQPNFDFFQNFDKRIQQLSDLGIEADVILFHPYDTEWDYFLMGDEMNERYVRYMIARISAYRNVWWSLANEWDVPKIKDTIDWEGIGTLLKKEDPHQRLIGIHNWYNTEDHFYDHSRPWLTHSSIQAAQFYNIPRWRDKYQKPVLFDEMRYEGNVPSGWGNLSAEEMASYFWMAGLSGSYPTHGETLQNDADDSTEVRWWAKGGTLVGGSMEPIRFFRQIMEEAPIHEMSPRQVIFGDSTELGKNIHILAKEQEYYLAYVADSAQTISLQLAGSSDYQLEIINTWNQQLIEQRTVSPGNFTYKTIIPYTAVRLIAKPGG